MSITKEQQQALEDALVPREQRLRIGNCIYRLSTTFKPKEPTFQVALDVLSLTPFYQAFLISAGVPAIYMHGFWATVSYHKHSIKFKMNKKSYSFDMETFREMLQICPNHPDLSIPKRNKADWHMAKDDPILTIMRFIPQHETVQKYCIILPDSLTNQSMKESKAYKTYYDLATGKATPKPNKRLKATAKVAKSRKKKQHDRGLETLSEIALSEAEHVKIALERSKTQQHSSHASGSGADEGTGDDDASKSKDDQDDTDDDDQDDADNDSERTKSNNDGDEFVHLKFTTHDEEDKEEESFSL
ncbi:hypothetical protein Tco_0668381 [Tanacetum coccineum]